VIWHTIGVHRIYCGECPTLRIEPISCVPSALEPAEFGVIYPAAASGAARLEESVTYDKLGNVKTRIDTAGRATTYDYDALNRLIKITDADNKLTQFEYNLRSQLTKV